MANYRKLIAWQKAHALALRIYKISDSFPSREIYGLTSQLRSAALSVPTNIVEGYSRTSQKEFKHFLDIALGSNAEATYLVEFAKDIGYLSTDDASDLLEDCEETARVLWGLRRSKS